MTFNFYTKSPSFLIACAEILSKISTFFMIPLAGLFLIPEDFNQWSIIFPSMQILPSILSFGLPNYLLRSYFLNKEEEKPNPNSIFIFFLILSTIWSLIFVIIKFFNYSNPFFKWNIYLISITGSFLQVIQQKFQAEKNGVRYFSQSLLWRVGFVGILVIPFIFSLKISIDFLLILMLFIQIILSIKAVYQECRPFSLTFDWSMQLDIAQFGFPLFLSAVLQYILYMNSRYFIYEKGDVNETAIFALVHTFIGTLNLLFVIFVRIYIIKLFDVLNGKNQVDSLSFFKHIIFTLFEILTIIIFICLFCYSAIYEIEFDKYIFMLTPILIIGQLSYAIQLFVFDSLLFYGKTMKMFLIICTTAIISVSISYFLVQKFGIYGAAFGTGLTQLLSLMIVLFFTYDLFKTILGLRYCLKRFFRISAIMLLGFICYFYFGRTPVIVFFILSICCLLWELDIPLVINKFWLN